MWIFCGGMQRSGSTLQYQIASDLIELLGKGTRTTYFDPARHHTMLNAAPPSGMSTFKTHQLTPAVHEVLAGSAAALYIFRDVRDVVGSLQQKNATKFEGERLAGLIRSLLHEDAGWRALPGVYVSKYEEVIGDIHSEVTRIADYLRLAPGPELINKIARDHSYESQLARIADVPMTDLIEVNAHNKYDKSSLLHSNHLQSGQIGRYRTDLDGPQLIQIESIAASWLNANGYSLSREPR